MIIGSLFAAVILLTASCDAQSKTIHNNCKCGVPKLSTRIIGGTDAKRNAYPWMTGVISVQGNLVGLTCGGSLISDRHILTAAHCFPKKDTNPAKVAVSIGKRTVNENYYSRLPVAKVTIHPDWDEKTNAEEKTLFNDIAIIQLKTPLKNFGTDYIPICLAHAGTPIDKLLLTGWGLTNSEKNGGEAADILQEITWEPMPLSVCKAKWGRQVDSNKQICAGTQGRAACLGDSGGPLSTQVKGQATQGGVVSFGPENCGTTNNLPGVFTRVSYYLDWIDENTKGALWCA